VKRKCKGTWLSEYLKFTDRQESPVMFHAFVGLTMLSAVIDRKIVLDHGYFEFFPNLYTILVAGSQKCRKSTAVRIGTKFLKNLPNPPLLLSQKMTKEHMVQELHQNYTAKKMQGEVPASSGIIVAPELTVFLSRESIQAGMLGTLVDLYDSDADWSSGTVARGVEGLKNVYLSFLGASSPEYLRISLPSNEVGGGMLARTLLVYQSRPKKPNPRPTLTPQELVMRDNIQEDLHKIQQLSGEVELAPEAALWYDAWYNKWFSHSTALEHDPALDSYYAGKHKHVLSIATLLSLSENDDMIITTSHLKRSIQLLNANEKMLPNVLGGLLTSPVGFKNQVVLDAIRILKENGLKPTRTNIMRRVHNTMDAEELTKCLTTLMEADLVQPTDAKGGSAVRYELSTRLAGTSVDPSEIEELDEGEMDW